jgi:hypothetical protein
VPDQKRRLRMSSSSLPPLLTSGACRFWRVSMAGGVGVPLADSVSSIAGSGPCADIQASG